MGRKTPKPTSHGTPKWVREQKNFDIRTGHFPKCMGAFPDCPAEVDANNPPHECRICPKFKA